MQRASTDRCPGVFRPWAADDGALVRLRLAGGRVTAPSLALLGEVAAEYGDGDVHLTRRANLQLRALPLDAGQLPTEVQTALERTGLLPSRSHELVRNIMCSPLTGRVGGRTDLRPVVAALDDALCADPLLAGLSARFLFVLDDGRGDLAERRLDTGLVAVDADKAQLRVGSSGWGEVVALTDAVGALLQIAHDFVAQRGTGDTAAWHIDELPAPLGSAHSERDPLTLVESPPLAYGKVPGHDDQLLHRRVADGILTPPLLADLLANAAGDLVVTPWHGILVDLPDREPT